jgi:hypothetical protein
MYTLLSWSVLVVCQDSLQCVNRLYTLVRMVWSLFSVVQLNRGVRFLYMLQPVFLRFQCQIFLHLMFLAWFCFVWSEIVKTSGTLDT